MVEMPNGLGFRVPLTSQHFAAFPRGSVGSPAPIQQAVSTATPQGAWDWDWTLATMRMVRGLYWPDQGRAQNLCIPCL